MYIVITRRLRTAHVRRLLHQLFFMQWPSALSLPAFQLLQSHTTHLTLLRILFPHQQRIFGAGTPGLFTIPSSASGASRAPRGHRPRSLPPGRANSSNFRRNWGGFSWNYGACGALTPAFWDSGVRAPSVRTLPF